jgi:hypothetical protein
LPWAWVVRLPSDQFQLTISTEYRTSVVDCGARTEVDVDERGDTRREIGRLDVVVDRGALVVDWRTVEVVATGVAPPCPPPHAASATIETTAATPTLRCHPRHIT